MSKNTVSLKESNEARSEEAYKALEEKITKLEGILNGLRENPLGEFSQLNSLVKVLEFEGYGLPDMLTKRTTLYKYSDLKDRYEGLVTAVKQINKDPASIDPVFAAKLKEKIEAEFQPDIDALFAEIEKYAELLTNEQVSRQAADVKSRSDQKEIKRLKKQLKLANDEIRSLTSGSNLRSV